MQHAPLSLSDRIIITGAAGLVGQNLCLMLVEHGFTDIVAIDRRGANLAQLKALNPNIRIIEADLAQKGEWQEAFAGGAALVQLHAHIGSLVPAEYMASNITATAHVLEAARAHQLPWLLHASSSVVHSAVVDDYTESKKAQETLVREGGIPHIILRPTLMFGWFDRKHLGWLSRFMRRAPIFPIPGDGAYARQPLYVRDFCRILLHCLTRPQTINTTYDITGAETISYLQMMKDIRQAAAAHCLLLPIPVWLFGLLLDVAGLFTAHPPFTRNQLQALIAPDHFALIPWWDIFEVPATDWQSAIAETFNHPRYSHVTLEF